MRFRHPERSVRFGWIAACAFPLFFAAAVACASEQMVDRVAAVVNQEVITQSDLDQLYEPLKAQLREAYQGEELASKLDEMRKKLLNQLIEDKLVLQEARRLGVEVEDNEVEERFQEFKKQFSEKDFSEMLKQQGIQLKAMKDRIRDQIMIQKLHYVEIRRKVVVSPLEIKKFYEDHPELFVDREKVKVWMITIPKSEESVRKGTMDEGAKKKTETLLKEIKKGKDFSELAAKESRDPHAKEGGLVGYVSRGDMIGNIDEVLFRLADSQMSDVIETERGYHIFKVGDHQKGKSLALEESRDKIHDMLFRQKANARFEAWMEELKKTAFISIR